MLMQRLPIRVTQTGNMPLSCRFSAHEAFQTYKKLENVLLKAANKESYDDDIEFITQLYGSDLNLQQLKLHLNILSSNLPQSSIAYDLSSIVEFIKKLSLIQKALIPQVHCLVWSCQPQMLNYF